VNSKNSVGQTPLHVVTDAQCAQLLIAAGADVHISCDRTEYSNVATPLQLAAYTSNHQLCQLLLQHGADVNALTPGLLSAATGVALSAGGADQLCDPRLQCMLLLEAAGADLLLCSESKQTMLHHCAKGGSVSVMQYLLHKLLQVQPDSLTLVDVDGNSPLHYAARYGTAALLKLLMSMGAVVSQRNLRQYTPLGELVALSSSSQDEQVDLFGALIDAGADVHSATDTG
jgi:uncharacterized protein